MSYLEAANHLLRIGVEDEDLAGFLGGDVDELVIGRDLYTLGLGSDGKRLECAGSDIDDADGGGVLVGHIDLRSIGTEIEVFGVGAAGYGADNLFLLDVEDADPVGRPVRRRQGAFVDARAGDGCSAKCDIEELVVGR